MGNLIIIVGQEGAGKSTIVRALLPHTPSAARIDGEDLGQLNPCNMDADFMALLWQNVVALIMNFWNSGYPNVVAGSFFDNRQEYVQFRQRLPADVCVYMVHLCASKAVRDQRRIGRAKPSTEASRNWVDSICPEDTTLRDDQKGYRYIRIRNDELSVEETIEAITNAIPEVYAKD